MDANLIDFYAGTNQAYVNRVVHLIKHWRIGTQANLCKVETDLNVVTMYFNFLQGVGSTGYGATSTQVTNVINNLITILQITNVTIDASTIINNVDNSVTNYYVTDTTEITVATGSYSGSDTFTVTIVHNLGKNYPTVEVFETSGIELIQVYPEVVVVDMNTVELNFTSTSSGKYSIH